MDDIKQALAQIAHIQERMTETTRFRGFAPEAVALTGALALAVAAAQAAWPQILAGDPVRFVLVWVGAALTASALIASEAVGRAHRLHGGMAKSMMSGTLRQFVPFGAAGATIGFVICTIAPAAAWVLPGLWQILIALLVFATLSTLSRTAIWAGAWYFVSGSGVLAWAAQTGGLSPWMMGVPFAVGQGLVAVALGMGGRDD